MCDTAQTPPVCVEQPGGGSDAQMIRDAPIDTAMGSCATSCAGNTPVCDAGNNTCRGCVKDAECSSDACSESTGACFDEQTTLYLSPSGSDGGTCTRGAPCQTVSRALMLVDMTHQAIKIADGSYLDSFVTTASFKLSGEGNTPFGATLNFIAGAAVHDHLWEATAGTVLAEGLTFTGGMAEAVRASGGTNMTLWRVAILDSMQGNLDVASSTVHAIECRIAGGQSTQSAVHVMGGMIDLQRSRVDNNIGGGIQVLNAASFDIANNIIVSNGNGAAGSTGAFVQTGAQPATRRFEANTIANNQSPTASAAATCAAALTFTGSIFATNGAAPQVATTCTVDYSLFSDAIPAAGTGNVVGTPGFANAGGGDYHLTNGSPALDLADPASTNKIDFDLDVRPKNGRNDMGADEH
jgi:hypothetical protein